MNYRIVSTRSVGSILTLALVLLVWVAGSNLAIAQTSAQRIRFSPGSSSASISQNVLRGERKSYVLGAAAGQRMQLSVRAIEENAVFQLLAPDGTVILQEARSVDFVLPADGDYQVVVGTNRGNASFRLNVSISNLLN